MRMSRGATPLANGCAVESSRQRARQRSASTSSLDQVALGVLGKSPCSRSRRRSRGARRPRRSAGRARRAAPPGAAHLLGRHPRLVLVEQRVVGVREVLEALVVGGEAPRQLDVVLELRAQQREVGELARLAPRRLAERGGARQLGAKFGRDAARLLPVAGDDPDQGGRSDSGSRSSTSGRAASIRRPTSSDANIAVAHRARASRAARRAPRRRPAGIIVRSSQDSSAAALPRSCISAGVVPEAPPSPRSPPGQPRPRLHVVSRIPHSDPSPRLARPRAD